MNFSQMGCFQRRENLASWMFQQIPVTEVLVQRSIVRVEQARPADPRECDDVGVVRAAGTDKRFRQPVDGVIPCGAYQSRADTLNDPSFGIPVSREFTA